MLNPRRLAFAPVPKSETSKPKAFVFDAVRYKSVISLDPLDERSELGISPAKSLQVDIAPDDLPELPDDDAANGKPCM